ncbi:hypothetical protein L596_023902 [Steinernema carpocapsae]|nr:hypothetical protein L596_023902 [Steinernema carpocapsae]
MEDMAYQMPEEWKLFQEITCTWKNINEQLLAISGTFEMLHMGTEHLKAMGTIMGQFQEIQGGFDTYLQKRKQVFPRLYFLSNAEVLDLLSEARNPESLRGYLTKLFRGIRKADFNVRGELISIESHNGERLVLKNPINVGAARRYVEKWLIDMERETSWAFKNALKSLKEEPVSPLRRLHQLVDAYPISVLAVYCRMAFTMIVEKGLTERTLDDSKKSLETVFEECRRQKKLKDIQIDCTYYLSVIDALIDNISSSQTDPIWYTALRYYWHNDNVFLRVLSLSFSYNYEYGITSRTRLEPERAYFNTHMSMLLVERLRYGSIYNHCDSMAIQEFTYRMGRAVIFYKCSPETSPEIVRSLLIGAIQSGTLLLLEEIDLLPHKVLGYLLSHMAALFHAIDKDITYYRMGQLEISVSPSFSIACSRSSELKYSQLAEVGFMNSSVSGCPEFKMFNEPSHINRLIKDFLHQFEQLFAIPIDLFLISQEATRLRKQELNLGVEHLVIFKTAVANILGPMVKAQSERMFERLMKNTFFTKLSALDRESDHVKARQEDELPDKLKGKVAQVFNLLKSCKKVALVGPPGCGKSTVCYLVGKLLKPKKVNCICVDQTPFDEQFSASWWTIFDGRYHKDYVDFVDGLCENGQNYKRNMEMVVLEENMRFIYESDSTIPGWPTVRFDHFYDEKRELEMSEETWNILQLRKIDLVKLWKKHSQYVTYVLMQGIPFEPKARQWVEKILLKHPDLQQKIPAEDGKFTNMRSSDEFFPRIVEQLTETNLIPTICGTSLVELEKFSEALCKKFQQFGWCDETIRLGPSATISDFERELQDNIVFRG